MIDNKYIILSVTQSTFSIRYANGSKPMLLIGSASLHLVVLYGWLSAECLGCMASTRMSDSGNVPAMPEAELWDLEAKMV